MSRRQQVVLHDKDDTSIPNGQGYQLFSWNACHSLTLAKKGEYMSSLFSILENRKGIPKYSLFRSEQ
jgi:hypothetical protein